MTATVAIRRGLRGDEADSEPPFTVTARPMRLRAGVYPSRLHDVDAALEAQRFQALNARLERERESR